MQIDENFGHWFAGFVDGEGCFVIDRVNKKHPTYRCIFSITVRADDRPILEEICGHFQIGNIYSITIHGHRARGAMLRVARKEYICRLITIFDRFPLRAKKRNDYAIWHTAAILWTNRVGYRASGAYNAPHPVQARLAELSAELNAQRRYSG